MKESVSSNLKVPIFRLYGVNEAGNSILAHLYGYIPYLYCSAPNGVKNSDLHKFTEALNSAAKFEVKTKEVPNNIVLGIKVVTKEVSLNCVYNSVLKIKLLKNVFLNLIHKNIYGFHGNKKSQFLCVEVVLPKVI